MTVHISKNTFAACGIWAATVYNKTCIGCQAINPMVVVLLCISANPLNNEDNSILFYSCIDTLSFLHKNYI